MKTKNLNDPIYLILFKILIVIGIIFILIFIADYFVYEKRKEEIINIQKEKEQKDKSKPLKPGIFAAVKILFQNKTLIYITIITLGYFLTINIIEVTWKAIILKYCMQNQINGGEIFAKVLIWQGVFSIAFNILSPILISRFSWIYLAGITPFLISISGLTFYGALFIIKWNPKNNLLFIAVLIGTIQNVVTKAAKYSFFDISRETAYSSLPTGERVNGKAVIDIIGGRLGKSIGAWLQTIFIIIIVPTTLIGSGLEQEIILLPNLVVISVIFFLWFYSVYKLSYKVEN